MTCEIHGNLQSSAFRVVWAAEELGIDYRLVEIRTEDCAESDALAALNPNRKIPVLVDGDTVLWESMAINLYLARRQGGSLAPGSSVEDAPMQMWSLWVSNECLADCFSVLSHAVLLPVADRSPAVSAEALGRLARPLRVLDDHLGASGGFVVGRRFTVADVNLASVIGWLRAARSDLTGWPHVLDWLKACEERPAAKRCAGMAAAEPTGTPTTG